MNENEPPGSTAVLIWTDCSQDTSKFGRRVRLLLQYPGTTVPGSTRQTARSEILSSLIRKRSSPGSQAQLPGRSAAPSGTLLALRSPLLLSSSTLSVLLSLSSLSSPLFSSLSLRSSFSSPSFLLSFFPPLLLSFFLFSLLSLSSPPLLLSLLSLLTISLYSLLFPLCISVSSVADLCCRLMRSMPWGPSHRCQVSAAARRHHRRRCRRARPVAGASPAAALSDAALRLRVQHNQRVDWLQGGRPGRHAPRHLDRLQPSLGRDLPRTARGDRAQRHLHCRGINDGALGDPDRPTHR